MLIPGQRRAYVFQHFQFWSMQPPGIFIWSLELIPEKWGPCAMYMLSVNSNYFRGNFSRKTNDKNECVRTLVKDEQKKSWPDIKILMLFPPWATILISYVILLFLNFSISTAATESNYNIFSCEHCRKRCKEWSFKKKRFPWRLFLIGGVWTL